MTAAEISDPVLSELPEGFGLHPICDLAEQVGRGVEVQLLTRGGRLAPRMDADHFIESAWFEGLLIPARITPPAPPEPETEWVPLAECLGREVMVDGERRVVEFVNLRRPSYGWFGEASFIAAITDANADGMVKVLVVPAPQGEGR